MGKLVSVDLTLYLSDSPLWFGYEWKIYQADSKLPAFNNWIEMFINGIKLIIVNFVYFLIPLIVFLVTGGIAIFGLIVSGFDNPSGIISALTALVIAIIISIVVFFIFALLAIIAIVRFARMDNFGEALILMQLWSTSGKSGGLITSLP